MPSVGEAAVRGIESGFGLGLRGAAMRAEEEERRRRERDAEQHRADALEERTYQRGRQKIIDKRQADQDARQARIDELKVLDSEVADLQTEGQGLWTQFGGYDKVPEDVRSDYSRRVRDARGRRASLRSKFHTGDVEQQQRQAAEIWSRVQAGQMSLDDVGSDDLVRTLTAQTRRPLADFVRNDPGQPSLIEQAALDVEAGLQTNNRDLLVKGANVLLRPELQTGIGTDGPDGNEIIDKTLVDLVAHPQQPGLFVPIVEVTVRRDDGALGKYRAPVTEGRGVYATDPGAMPKAISVQDAIERVGQLGTLAKVINQPDMRQRIDGASPAARAGADEFLQALGSVGVSPPKPGKISRERVDLGSHVLEREVDENGRVIGEKRLGKGLAPSRGDGGGPSQAEREVDRALRRGLITPEEARKRLRDVALGPSGRGQMTNPADTFKAENTLRDEHTKQSGTFVKIRDAFGKLRAAASEPSAAGDIALIFGYMRMLDPDSVVREGEFATAQNAASIPDRIRNTYNKALEGERLNPRQRADMVEQARKVYAEQKRAQDKLDRTYTDLANRYGLNADNVVQRFELDDGTGGQAPRLPADPQAAATAYQRLPSGAEFIDPNGVRRRKP